jgi:hypothetical protein
LATENTDLLEVENGDTVDKVRNEDGNFTTKSGLSERKFNELGKRLRTEILVT